MSTLLLSSVSGGGHETYLAINGAGQYDHAFTQLFLQLIAQIPETVHIYALQLGCQYLDAVYVSHLIHHVAQGVLRRLALQSLVLTVQLFDLCQQMLNLLS